MKTQEIKIWTEAYTPFIMGGDVNAPITTKVTVKGDPIDVGHGITVFEVVSPKGQTFIVETKTGAFVGSTIEQVKKDVSAADPKVIKDQLKQAVERFKKAKRLTPEQFWSCFR